jgi:hypothetical protein
MVFFAEKVILVLYIAVNGAHDVAHFEADTTYFYQVAPSNAVARKIYLRLVSRADDLPNFFFGFSLEHLIDILVNELLVVHPVGIIAV